MPGRSLRIAWLGAGPGVRESGGVPGVATDLLQGLARRGHRVDCFLPGRARELPERVRGEQNITFVWGTVGPHSRRWYNRTRITAFASGLLVRGAASVRLRRELLRGHRREPYDVIYQFSNIESLAVPARLRRAIPLVIHPETHIMGELRFLISERRLALRCQPTYTLALAALVMSVRAVIQRLRDPARRPAGVHQQRVSRSPGARLSLSDRAHGGDPESCAARALRRKPRRARRAADGAGAGARVGAQGHGGRGRGGAPAARPRRGREAARGRRAKHVVGLHEAARRAPGGQRGIRRAHRAVGDPSGARAQRHPACRPASTSRSA